MKRYIHLTVSVLVIYVFASNGLFLSNSTIELVCTADEQIDSEIGEPDVHAEDEDHDHDHPEDEDHDHDHPEDDDHVHAAENSVTLTDKAKANIGLKTADVGMRTIGKVVQVTGNIISHPGKRAIVTPRIGGIVKHVHFKLGDTVKKGDVLLELESIDLQLAVINLIEAAHQQKSLNATSVKQKSVFAKQIRLELQTRQIDLLQSLTELQEQKNAFQKHRSIAIAKTKSALEQMRVELVKSHVERNLLEDTLKRIKSLTDLRFSAQKELITKQAEYIKATNVFTGTKRQLHLLGVSDETVSKILSDDGSTPIMTLLNSDSKMSDKSSSSKDKDVLKYVTLIDEAAELVDAESAYKSADIRVEANKHRALAVGMTAIQLETLSKTRKIESFDELSAEGLIEKYAPFMTSSETLEALLQIEESQRNAAIQLAKVRSQLQVYGMTAKEIDRIIESGKQQSQFYVTAPAAGQIIKQDVTLGATVDKSNSLYSILDTDVVWVESEVYEDTLAVVADKWQVGSVARIRTPAYPEKFFTGKISQISAIVNPEKRTVSIWTEVGNSEHHLKPGMFAEQTFVIEELDDVLSVPLNAILEDGATQIVFVESGNTYVKHEVEVGVKDDQHIEIKEGLLAGEKVVIQGMHQLMRAAAGSAVVIDPHAGHSH